MIFAFAPAQDKGPIEINYRRQWSESSAPVVAGVYIIGTLVSAAVLLLLPPSHLTERSLFIYRILTCNTAGIFILTGILLAVALICKESNEDIIYYAKTHKEEVIKKLQQYTEEPKKISYRKDQVVISVISLLGILLSFASVYAYSRFIRPALLSKTLAI